MKQLSSKIIIASVIIMMVLWSVPIQAATAVPEDYRTYELSGFCVSLPGEFEKSDGWSSETNMSFNSNKLNLRDDGDEYISSATINVYDMEGDITELNQYAENMLWSVKAQEETCDDPVVEGNTVLLRSVSELDDGNLISWRFLVVNEDGKIAGGTISYRGEEAKFYDDIVSPIIQSIQFK